MRNEQPLGEKVYRWKPLSLAGNAIRGALIGIVETIPGVSGGTVALVVGIYDDLIGSAHHATAAVRRLATGPDRKAGFIEEIRGVQWALLLPVMIGMMLAVFTVAGPMKHLVEVYPQQVKAVFFGMVLASVLVPLKLAGGKFSLRDVVTISLAAVGTFGLLSLPAMSLSANPITIIATAALAVSALVLPGISGSFLLYTFGLYEPTLGAVAERNFGYLALFMTGALIGLVVIVKALRWLLTHHHRVTMIALAGMMIGALRSLWPWQDDQTRQLFGPAANWPLLLGLLVAGAVVVLAMIAIEAKLAQRSVHEISDDAIGKQPARRAQG